MPSSLTSDYLANRAGGYDDYLAWRGGGYDEDVYIFESCDMEPERQLLKPELYHIDTASIDENLTLLRNSISTFLRSIRTNGDGTCGVHALFGSPALSYHGGYELFASRAREIAEYFLDIAGKELPKLEEDPRTHQLIGGIKTILWTEFVVRHLTVTGGSTSESNIFWRSLERHVPELAAEAKLVVESNRSSEVNFENLKIRTCEASRKFFIEELEKDFIRPLAVRLGYIPDNTDVLQLSKFELAELALSCSEDNFLEEASRDGFCQQQSNPCCKLISSIPSVSQSYDCTDMWREC